MKKIIIVGIVLYFFNEYKRNRPPKIYYVKSLPKGYNAQTIPPFGIFIKEEYKNNMELLEHELVHWKQYQRMNLLPFYFQYFKELREYGYDNAPMEIEARFIENDFCKKNYTQCVRDGIAKTISNKNFKK